MTVNLREPTRSLCQAPNAGAVERHQITFQDCWGRVALPCRRTIVAPLLRVEAASVNFLGVREDKDDPTDAATAVSPPKTGLPNHSRSVQRPGRSREIRAVEKLGGRTGARAWDPMMVKSQLFQLLMPPPTSSPA